MSTNKYSEHSLKPYLDSARLPFEKSEAQAWSNVLERIDLDQGLPMRRSSGRFYSLRIAASLLFLLTAGFAFWYAGKTEISSSESAGQQVALPDGSLIVLDQSSTLSFNTSIWFLDRSIDLKSGRAFFEVEKGKQFTVHTPMGDVAVLGTSFDVSLFKSQFAVACKTGKVRVSPKGDDRSIELTPGQASLWDGASAKRNSVESAQIGGWAIGEFAFDNVALQDVLQVLSKEFGYTIDLNEKTDLRYTGYFKKDQPLEEILSIVCKPLNLKYTIDFDEKRVLILKN